MISLIVFTDKYPGHIWGACNLSKKKKPNFGFIAMVRLKKNEFGFLTTASK